MEIKTLFKTDWVELREMKDPKQGVHGYSYIHESRCNGKIVAILPFKEDYDGNIQYYLRSEVTPCWGMTPALSSVTGGVERDDVMATAVMELEEEAGFEAKESDFIKLGTCRGVKSADTVYHLFAVNCTNLKKVEAKGDGSELEAKATMVWTNPPDIVEAEDPLVAMLFVRFCGKVDTK